MVSPLLSVLVHSIFVLESVLQEGGEAALSFLREKRRGKDILLDRAAARATRSEPPGTTPELKKRGAAPRYAVAAPLLCAYVVELLPLFLPLNGRFWLGKDSIIQDYPSPQSLENRAFREKPGLDRLLFSQFESSHSDHKSPETARVSGLLFLYPSA